MPLKKWIILCGISLLFLTGCWDKVEINERAFIVAVGLDKFEEKVKVNEKSPLGEPSEPEDQPRNRYTITYTFPNTGVIAGKGEGEASFIFTGAGKDFYDVEKLMSTKIKNTVFFGHTKVFVIGEALARDEALMREVLDAIERSPLLGRKINIVITPEKAKDVLNSKPPLDPKAGIYIFELLRQKANTARMADADLGYILRSLHESQTAIAPRIVATEEDIKIAGAAVLKEYRLVGWLGEMETRALMFMQDKIKTTEVSPKIDEKIIPVEITESNTEMRAFERDGEIVVAFKVEAEGVIEQHLFGVKGETFDEKYIRNLEKIAARDIHMQIQETYEKLQKEYQVDVVQAGEHLRKFQPDLWARVKDQWKEIYPYTKLEVSVELKIRRVGVSR